MLKENPADSKIEVEKNENPVVEQQEELSFAKKIELENKIKDLEAEISKLKASEKQLILATRLNTLKEQDLQNKEFRKFANQKIIKNLVHTLLNFQRALNFKTDNKEVANFLVGFKFIYQELLKDLEPEGLKEITASVGEQFNSHKHEAVEVIYPDEAGTYKKTGDNTITEVLSVGYELHNRVISTIKVKIFKKEKPENKKN